MAGKCIRSFFVSLHFAETCRCWLSAQLSAHWKTERIKRRVLSPVRPVSDRREITGRDGTRVSTLLVIELFVVNLSPFLLLAFLYVQSAFSTCSTRGRALDWICVLELLLYAQAT